MTQTVRRTPSFMAPFHQMRFPVVGVAASTSGPQALRTLLSGLPADFKAAVLVAQHLSDGFVERLVAWLQQFVALPVRIAQEGMPLRAGVVYLAPDGRHITVRENRLSTPQACSNDLWRPSANALFLSMAQHWRTLSVAVVLTGMGKDGTEGALAVRQAGGRVIVQDPDDAPVNGMPRAVIERGAYDIVLPLKAIPSYLVSLVNRLSTSQHAPGPGHIAPKSDPGQ